MLNDTTWTKTEADAEFARWKRLLMYGAALMLGLVAVLYWLPG